MSNTIPLSAEAREITGKGPARSLRRQGQIPAVIYGQDKQPVHITISEKEITNYYRKGGFTSLVFDIEVAGKKYSALPKSVQLHPVTDAIEHADFIFVGKDSEVKVTVPLHFLNEDKTPGIKKGGILSIVNREIELLCNPYSIPPHIDVDVSTLDIGHSLHIEDITLPKGARLVASRNATIATIVGRGSDDEKSAEAPTEAAKSGAKGSK